MRTVVGVVTLLTVIACAITTPAASAVSKSASPAPASAVAAGSDSLPPLKPDVVAAKDRKTLLGAKWKSSTDRAWTTTGDADGFHLLVADEKTGYAWRNAATLSEPGFDADQWIGNVCVTGSGRRAVVVYAPRTFTNKPELFARGGFTAVVDLATGQVDKLPLQATLSYFSPGCGTGESAVLTQDGGETSPATRLVTVQAATATLAEPISLVGQVTSAIPVDAGAIVAADSARVIRIEKDGQRRTLARTDAVPFDLRADRNGGVVFLDRANDTASVRRVLTAKVPTTPTKPVAVATGPLTQVGLTTDANGTVFVTGSAKATTAALPAPVSLLPVARSAQISTEGGSAVVSTRWADGKDSRLARESAADPRPVDIDLKVLDTNRSLGFGLDPTLRAGSHRGEGTDRSPALTAATSTKAKAKVSAAAAGSATNPIEAERYCSVPRNDPGNQVTQPKPRQVEWAVDQAITDNLNGLITRPENWKNLGMPSYRPQVQFNRLELTGGGRVPAQVMLGILAQESNLWMTSRAAVPGVTGSPLIGNFYGRDIYNKNPDGSDNTSDDWNIRWDKADCGYGITQMTDHMRLAGKEKNAADFAWDYQTQRAVALDYTVNIAAGLQTLASKWNETRAAGLTLNNGDASKIENWFYAVWAYNSGFHPKSEASANGGAWGVGWQNNPANPKFPANREPFMEVSAADAARPQYWPYPEKVLGFAGHPPSLLEAPSTEVAAFRAAWWNGDATSGPGNRRAVKPPVNQFCDSSNQCEPGKLYTPNDPEVAGAPAGPCAHKNASGQYDLKCWYNRASTWKSDCSLTCGNELLRFNNTYAEQPDGTPYPPACTTAGLPSNALVIDDLPNTASSARGCPGWGTNAGTFSFNFASDANGLYPSKVDLHQLGAGFGGHFYFGHSRTSSQSGGTLKITGTWKLNSSRNSWSRIMVHLPDHGAHSQQAKYEIDTGNGTFSRTRYLNQKRKANAWVSLGVYKLDGVPRIRLSTETEDGTGDDDVAFDAVAFQPLPAKPKHIVAVLGDSYTSGEGVGNYYAETDTDHGTPRWNACRRSRDSWPRRVVLPGTSTALGTKADNWDTDVDLGFVACSGAQNVNAQDWSWDYDQQPDNEGQFGEQKQVRSGVLSGDTSLVMLTLGGNDLNGFAKAMMECAPPVLDCSGAAFLTKYKAIGDVMVRNLKVTLQEITKLAPKARVVLMGYPELFSRTLQCGGTYALFNSAEEAALAELVNYVDGKQQALIDDLRTTSKLKTEYANPVSDFVGHGACDADAWIRTVVVGPEGDGDFHTGDAAAKACSPEWMGGKCISRSSYHPNKTGAGDPGFAGVMRKRLEALGYAGGTD